MTTFGVGGCSESAFYQWTGGGARTNVSCPFARPYVAATVMNRTVDERPLSEFTIQGWVRSLASVAEVAELGVGLISVSETWNVYVHVLGPSRARLSLVLAASTQPLSSPEFAWDHEWHHLGTTRCGDSCGCACRNVSAGRH